MFGRREATLSAANHHRPLRKERVMARYHSFVAFLTITVLLGQGWLTSDSLLLDDRSPVAADLVELTLAIPQAVTNVEEAEANGKRIRKLRQHGVIPASEFIELQRTDKLASRKLELLRILVDVELKAAEAKARFLTA